MRRCAYLLALLMAGCGAAPISSTMTDNPEGVKLDLLFTHEGCKMYRFMDNGHFHYFADCRGTVTSTESCGKGCSRTDSVQTTKESQ